MNAIMASPGGRAPPGQNTLTPCEESRSPVEVGGARAPRPSASRPYRSERQLACRCRPPPSSPTPEASAPCSRSWLKPKLSSPIATDAHVRGPGPAAQRANGSQAKTCCLSACSWLHLLKSWSLRSTRGGSPSHARMVLRRFRKEVILAGFAAEAQAHGGRQDLTFLHSLRSDSPI